MLSVGARCFEIRGEITMPGVQVSEHFGLVIRKTSLQKHSIPMNLLLQQMEIDRPFDEDEDLLSLGPHFGGEAMQEFVRRLETFGLKYGEDFIDFADTLPGWCQVYIRFNP
jgi:hypothetical protein